MDRITIEGGMQDISSGTCIRFIPRTHEPNFLDIQPRYGWVQLTAPFLCLWTPTLSHSLCMCCCFASCLSFFFVAHSKLLVISGTDGRESDPVPADPWVHVVRSGCARANARPGLRARAVSLRPGQLRHNCVEEHHGWSGWTDASTLWRI